MSTYLRLSNLEKAPKTSKLEERVSNKVKLKRKYKYKDYRLVTYISKRIKKKRLKDNYNNTLLISIVFLTLIRKLLTT